MAGQRLDYEFATQHQDSDRREGEQDCLRPGTGALEARCAPSAFSNQGRNPEEQEQEWDFVRHKVKDVVTDNKK